VSCSNTRCGVPEALVNVSDNYNRSKVIALP